MDHGFFNQDTLELSKQLLGAELTHQTNKGNISGKIVEVEAYLGRDDRAAHSYGGRRTKRTEVMFGPPGHAYLYLIYGIHVCLNVVGGPIGTPEAILIRALEPTHGTETMIENRAMEILQDSQGGWKPNKIKQLTNGPGKLVQALGVSLNMYGHDLLQSPLSIIPPDNPVPEKQIATGPRIGIENTWEARDYPYRFWITQNPFVSK